MPVFKWENKLSVNIENIDDEHKKLIDMLNEFYDNIISKTNKENVLQLIGKMKDYTIFHFTNEENLLRDHEYPRLDAHIAEHKKFVDKVGEMEQRFNEGKLILSLEVTTFLKDWLINHIMVSDQKYAEYFKKRGINI